MARILVLINDMATLSPGQTTTALARGLSARGHLVGMVPANGLDVEPDGSLHARVWTSKAVKDKRWVDGLRTSAPKRVALDTIDLVLVRTSPGRAKDAAHHALLLQLLHQHKRHGGLVLNDPVGLFAASSKLYITRFPEWTRPGTLVSADAERLRAFVHERQGRTVLKPISGTQGRDVFFVEPGADNLSAIIDNLLRQGPVVAQDFLVDAANGDVRLLLVDGRPIGTDGTYAAVRRRPAKGELRSNVHLGGHAEYNELSLTHKRIIKAVGPTLRKDGLFLVGLDVVGDAIVECNVFAAGGLTDAGTLAGADFLTPVLESIEGRIEAHQAKA